MDHPHPRVYYIVFGLLLALLAITVAASELSVGRAAFLIATLIATAKAALILLFFMHVRYSRPLIWVVALAGFFWLGILFGLTFSDYATRARAVRQVSQTSSAAAGAIPFPADVLPR